MKTLFSGGLVFDGDNPPVFGRDVLDDRGPANQVTGVIRLAYSWQGPEHNITATEPMKRTGVSFRDARHQNPHNQQAFWQ